MMKKSEKNWNYVEFVKDHNGEAPKFRISFETRTNAHGHYFFGSYDAAKVSFDVMIADPNFINVSLFNLETMEELEAVSHRLDADVLPVIEEDNEIDYIYIVNTGVVRTLDINSGDCWLNEEARFNNLDDAIKFYDSIKHDQGWSAPWGLTEIQRVRVEDIDAYDFGELVNTDLLYQYFEPQRAFGNDRGAIECK